MRKEAGAPKNGENSDVEEKKRNVEYNEAAVSGMKRSRETSRTLRRRERGKEALQITHTSTSTGEKERRGRNVYSSAISFSSCLRAYRGEGEEERVSAGRRGSEVRVDGDGRGKEEGTEGEANVQRKSRRRFQKEPERGRCPGSHGGAADMLYDHQELVEDNGERRKEGRKEHDDAPHEASLESAQHPARRDRRHRT
jgi:hypothetical protein